MGQDRMLPDSTKYLDLVFYTRTYYLCKDVLVFNDVLICC